MFFYAILGVVAWIALALWPAFMAKRKGYSFILFLLLGIFISFILAFIIAAVLKDRDPAVAAAEAAAEEDIERETGLV